MEGYGDCWEKTSTYWKCVNIIPVKDQEQRSFERMPREKGKQGQLQHESPAREYLEQVNCNDTDCTPRIMKQAFLALKGGD